MKDTNIPGCDALLSCRISDVSEEHIASIVIVEK
jgi:hypothetical protein